MSQSFGYGLGDGLLDLLVKPMEGAKNHGAVGLATGLAKGVGNAVCKPVAGQYMSSPTAVAHANLLASGSCGLVGYSTLGVYKAIRNIKVSDKEECPADVVRRLGEVEYGNATDPDKLYVVRVWCQTMMRVRLV
jgi:hypothetical protein